MSEVPAAPKVKPQSRPTPRPRTRFPGSFARATLVGVAPGLVFAVVLALAAAPAPARGQADAETLVRSAGRWIVAPPDSDAPAPPFVPAPPIEFDSWTRLARLDVAHPDSLGNVEFAVFAQPDDPAAPPAPLARGRVERSLRGDSAARWLRAEILERATNRAVSILVRADSERPERLRLLVRVRANDPVPKIPEYVREYRMIRDPAAPPAAPARPGRPPALNATRSDVAPAGLFLIDPDGSGVRRVAPPDGFARAADPAWSPDGRAIAFAAYDAVGRDPLIRVVLPAPDPAPEAPAFAVAAGAHPAWSPDGAKLAYTARGKPESTTDWRDVGRNNERVALLPLLRPGDPAGASDPPLRPRHVADGYRPEWSPDGARLAYGSRRGGNDDLYVLDVATNRETRLTTDPSWDGQPFWTPDGRAILFLSNRGNRWDLYRVELDNPAEVVRVTNNRMRKDRASLSPDGAVLAFTERPDEPDSRILLLDLAAETAYRLTDAPNGDRDPAWSPDGRRIAFVSARVR